MTIELDACTRRRDVRIKKRVHRCLPLRRLHKTDKTDAKHQKDYSDHAAQDVAVHIPDYTTAGIHTHWYTARMQALKYVLGVILILIGFIALVTPLTPGAWLMFVGLELVGVRLTIWDKIKSRFNEWRGVQAPDTSRADSETEPKA